MGLGIRLTCCAALVALAGCPSDDSEPAMNEGGSSSNGSTTASTTDTSTTDSPTTTIASSSSASSDASSSSSTGDGEPAGPPGEFDVLSYNVAGLPQGISSSDPENNIPQISPLLNAFPMVLVQEDFWYHDELSAEVTLPHASEPYTDMPKEEGIGDGLNRFGEHPFSEVERVAWYDCHGQLDCASDCLARKGWSYARTTIAPGIEIDVYNLHMEAGGCPEDLEIRLQSALDLAEAIAERSADRALIVAGDFNLRATDPEDVEPLANIVDGAGLIDACDAVDCGDQRIDHVMVRSGADLQIEVLEWWIPKEFVDAKTGEPLSDHLPVAARVRYTPL